MAGAHLVDQEAEAGVIWIVGLALCFCSGRRRAERHVKSFLCVLLKSMRPHFPDSKEMINSTPITATCCLFLFFFFALPCWHVTIFNTQQGSRHLTSIKCLQRDMRYTQPYGIRDEVSWDYCGAKECFHRREISTKFKLKQHFFWATELRKSPKYPKAQLAVRFWGQILVTMA